MGIDVETDDDVMDGSDDDSGEAFLESIGELSSEQVVFSETNAYDSDGDGLPDTYVTETYYDMDDDGFADAVQTETHLDLDEDGTVDYSSISIVSEDDTGEGYNVFIGEDSNGNGTYESTTVLTGLDEEGNALGFYHYNPMEGGMIDGYTSFDADGADMDDIVGSPVETMQPWHTQETPSTCAVAAQEFVLDHFFDRDFTESELREIAEENGWYADGTLMQDVGNLLEHFGLNVERSTDNSLEDIGNCLNGGGQVIVGVDADELWEGGSDDFFGPGMGANHAIQVIGIDQSDPENPMVIINDSGVANGCGAMVSADLFMDAWNDSGNYMVEAYL